MDKKEHAAPPPSPLRPRPPSSSPPSPRPSSSPSSRGSRLRRLPSIASLRARLPPRIRFPSNGLLSGIVGRPESRATPAASPLPASPPPDRSDLPDTTSGTDPASVIVWAARRLRNLKEKIRAVRFPASPSKDDNLAEPEELGYGALIEGEDEETPEDLLEEAEWDDERDRLDGTAPESLGGADALARVTEMLEGALLPSAKVDEYFSELREELAEQEAEEEDADAGRYHPIFLRLLEAQRRAFKKANASRKPNTPELVFEETDLAAPHGTPDWPIQLLLRFPSDHHQLSIFQLNDHNQPETIYRLVSKGFNLLKTAGLNLLNWRRPANALTKSKRYLLDQVLPPSLATKIISLEEAAFSEWVSAIMAAEGPSFAQVHTKRCAEVAKGAIRRIAGSKKWAITAVPNFVVSPRWPERGLEADATVKREDMWAVTDRKGKLVKVFAFVAHPSHGTFAKSPFLRNHELQAEGAELDRNANLLVHLSLGEGEAPDAALQSTFLRAFAPYRRSSSSNKNYGERGIWELAKQLRHEEYVEKRAYLPSELEPQILDWIRQEVKGVDFAADPPPCRKSPSSFVGAALSARSTRATNARYDREMGPEARVKECAFCGKSFRRPHLRREHEVQSACPQNPAPPPPEPSLERKARTCYFDGCAWSGFGTTAVLNRHRARCIFNPGRRDVLLADSQIVKVADPDNGVPGERYRLNLKTFDCPFEGLDGCDNHGGRGFSRAHTVTSLHYDAYHPDAPRPTQKRSHTQLTKDKISASISARGLKNPREICETCDWEFTGWGRKKALAKHRENCHMRRLPDGSLRGPNKTGRYIPSKGYKCGGAKCTFCHPASCESFFLLPPSSELTM